MKTLHRHKTSVVLISVMIFAIALYFFIVPILTEKANAPTDTPPSPLVLLQQNDWVWQDATLPDSTAIQPENSGPFVLKFNDGDVSSSTDCNTIRGTYKTKDTTLTFLDVSITEKGCPGSQDTDYFDYLTKTIMYTIKKNTLTLTADDGTIMIFTKMEKEQ
ncbi:MAG: META domain-containing protein [Candidatus Spechtbacteria bacterium SB0662_bin_43]|uniref:META domain-containing protein n=1 Tax=Candidatus Spechtbacteria bacterium SB0662_bin_43 TaxID=2604897 RepID=A0A845DAU4_9BACT|nr:META domain-containing protein [Candidatus Spechtbacteria bacterium SB0662_bin_43]